MIEPRKMIATFSLFTLTTILAMIACKTSTPSEETKPTTTSSMVGQPKSLPSASQMTISPTASSTPYPTFTPTNTLRPSPTQTSNLFPTITSTLTPYLAITPTSTPTYAILRGTVLEQANCRYGPGVAYLYKYGLYPGFNIEIIGRNDLGTWIVIQAIGGSNPCWVNALLLDIHGEVMSLAPASLPLPQSPYYGPLTGVFAERIGNNVIISWNPLQLKAGDDSGQFPYLIEAWVCQDGQLTFLPIGSWETIATVMDNPGCSEPSHARIYGVEKHGYTLWVTIPWPAP
jgi:hypothetical protein